jgi:hypothetical protein
VADIKTKPTRVDVDAFLDAIDDPGKRDDARTICAMMARVSGEPATMWGPTIVGFGSYHYRYASGHEGTMCRMGFSPRAANLTLYVLPGSPREDELLAGLGKHKRSKGCLYIKRLADVNEAVLELLVTESWRHMAKKHPGPSD